MYRRCAGKLYSLSRCPKPKKAFFLCVPFQRQQSSEILLVNNYLGKSWLCLVLAYGKAVLCGIFGSRALCTRHVNSNSILNGGATCTSRLGSIRACMKRGRTRQSITDRAKKLFWQRIYAALAGLRRIHSIRRFFHFVVVVAAWKTHFPFNSNWREETQTHFFHAAPKWPFNDNDYSMFYVLHI